MGMSIIENQFAGKILEAERRAEWLGNDNRKTMKKVKTIGQILSFEKRHGFAQSISPGSAFYSNLCFQ